MLKQKLLALGLLGICALLWKWGVATPVLLFAPLGVYALVTKRKITM